MVAEDRREGNVLPGLLQLPRASGMTCQYMLGDDEDRAYPTMRPAAGAAAAPMAATSTWLSTPRHKARNAFHHLSPMPGRESHRAAPTGPPTSGASIVQGSHPLSSGKPGGRRDQQVGSPPHVLLRGKPSQG